MIVLGPLPCHACKAVVFWGRREYRGALTGDVRWRDQSDSMPHVCVAALVCAVEEEIARLTAQAREMGLPVGL